MEKNLGNEKVVVLPKEMNGIPVKRIGSYVILREKEIKIPDGIEVIGDSALTAKELKSIMIKISFRRCALVEYIIGGEISQFKKHYYIECSNYGVNSRICLAVWKL